VSAQDFYAKNSKGARGGGVNQFFPSSLPLKIKKIKKTVCGFFFYFFKLKFNSIILIYRRRWNAFQLNTLLLYVFQFRNGDFGFRNVLIIRLIKNKI
jgi:hypothetical protein